MRNKCNNNKLDEKDKSGYSSRENEINIANDPFSDKGRNVYYNGNTEGKNNGKFRIRASSGRFVIISHIVAHSTSDISEKLVQGE